MQVKNGAYESGRQCRDAGKSIHYNPYRNRPIDRKFGAWVQGWEDAERRAVATQPTTHHVR